MNSLLRLLRSTAPTLLIAFAATVGPGVWAGDGTTAVAGIVEGTAVLIRQTTRHALAEGVALRSEDIVETAPGAFIQIEFDNELIVSLGEASRAILGPRLQRSKAEKADKSEAAVQVYLLEGWLKATPPAKADAPFNLLTPRIEVNAKGAALVALSRPTEYGVFVETGSARVVERLPEKEGARASLGLKAGDFGSRGPSDDKAVTKPRVSAEFVARMPKVFLDRLPPRAALLTKRPSAPKALDAIAYADVAPWLRSEPAVRLPLSKQWRSRATDKRFRAELQANIAAHMEWEPVVFPERFIKKAEAAASAAASASASSAVKPAEN